MKDALNLAIIGTTVVIISLVLIIICIKIYTAIVAMINNRNNKSINKNNDSDSGKGISVHSTTNVNSSSSLDGLSPELIAVITAAIAACMDSSGAGLQVKSIKRIGHNTPIWNVAGRNEHILSKI